jgi:hypothetical protein
MTWVEDHRPPAAVATLRSFRTAAARFAESAASSARIGRICSAKKAIIDLGDMVEAYKADPNRDDWPVVPIRTIVDGKPAILWWPRELGMPPAGHVPVWDEDVRWWIFRPIQTN